MMRRFTFISLIAAICIFSLGATYINGVEYLQSLRITESATGTAITGPLFLGGETTSHSLTNDGSLVANAIEANAVSYFDAIVYHSAAVRMADTTTIDFGTSNDAFVYYNVAQTADALAVGVSDDSRSIVIHEKGDFATDFTHALQTNPTIYIQSSDATNVNQFIGLAHDQTNGVIDVGTGKLTTPDAFQAADYYSGDGTQGATDNTSFWLCTAADCSTKCQVTIKDGLITSCT